LTDKIGKEERNMPGKHYTPEQNINSLSKTEVMVSQGNTADKASRQHLKYLNLTYY